jgi:hypothetical protein
MSHKIKNKLYLPNVQEINLADVDLKIGTHGTAGTDVTQTKLSSMLVTEELEISSTVIITDVGDANGGYGAHSLVVLPASDLLLIGSLIDVAITGDGVNISATAAVDVAVGTAAEAADSTLDGTSADIIAKIDAPLTTSEGVAAGPGPPSGTPVVIDATGGTQGIYLNFGVPDADISANGTIVVVGTIRLIYLDITKGA